MSDKSLLPSPREASDDVPVIHTLDKTRDELKRAMFFHLYGGPKPTVDYRKMTR